MAKADEVEMISKRTGITIGLLFGIVAFVIGVMVNIGITDKARDKQYYELLQLINNNANAISNLSNAISAHSNQKGWHYDLQEKVNELEKKVK